MDQTGGRCAPPDDAIFQKRGDPQQRETRILQQPLFHHGIPRRAVALHQTRAFAREPKETSLTLPCDPRAFLLSVAGKTPSPLHRFPAAAQAALASMSQTTPQQMEAGQ